MLVHVKLYNEVKLFVPGDENVFTQNHLPDATVRELLAGLQITDEVPRSILINGMLGDDNSPLTEGCTVVLFTPVCGG